MIAAQAIVSSMYNFDTEGNAFTWAGVGLRNQSPGNNNAEGLKRLSRDDSVFMKSYSGDLTPSVDVIYKDEKPQILRVTNDLLKYAEVHLRVGGGFIL